MILTDCHMVQPSKLGLEAVAVLRDPAGERFSDMLYRFHPMANTTDYSPALYVHNIVLGEWLSKSVEGLLNDGIILPSLDTERPIVSAFLMRVQRDVLKLALVWSIDVESDEDDVVSDQTEVHWSKFILRIEREDNTRTLHAECLSSGAFYGGNTLLINCTAG
ncbi:hypothetical protein ACLB2K_013622 [Fragaria x ananassa]